MLSSFPQFQCWLGIEPCFCFAKENFRTIKRYGSCDILIKIMIFKVVIIGAVEMTQLATTPEDLSSILGPTKWKESTNSPSFLATIHVH